MKQYDVIIIGTGAANIIADAAIGQHKHIAIIERGRFGGTCLNRGCIPTKVMVTAANLLCEIREGARIGVTAENATLDWDTMARRLWQKIDESPAIQTYYDQFPDVDTYNGTASFTGKKTIAVTKTDGSSEELEGRQIFIGTGGRTNIPALPGLEDCGYITSEHSLAPNSRINPIRA